MPSRRFHNKTRHGCGNCKHRRKKCDSQTPRCGGCTRLGLVCQYEHISALSTSTRANILPSFTNPGVSLVAVNGHTVLLNPNEIGLLSHLFVESLDSFRTIPAILPLKALHIPSLSHQYPYLVHGLLAISSLHVYSARTSDTRFSPRHNHDGPVYMYHRQAALASYIPSVASINEQTHQSIFNFALILACIGFAELSLKGDTHYWGTQTYLDNFAAVLRLLQGAVAIAEKAGGFIPKCRSTSSPDLSMAAVLAGNSPARRDTFENLEASIHSVLIATQDYDLTLSDHEVAGLQKAIFELRNVSRGLRRPVPENFRSAIGWAAFIDGSMCSLITRSHPAAMVVLAHYGACLHLLGDVWWLDNVGRNVVESISSILTAHHDPAWQELLRWPQEMVRHQLPPLSTSPTEWPLTLLFEKSLISGPPTVFETALVYTYRP